MKTFHLARFLLASIFSFELLNSVRILNFSFPFEFLDSVRVLNFSFRLSWMALAALTFSCWLVWETILREKFRFSKISNVFIFLLVFHLYANSLGCAFSFYNKFSWYDMFTHFSGGLMGGSLFFLTLKFFQEKKKVLLGSKEIFLFASTLTFLGSVIFEFSEYITQKWLDVPVLGTPSDTIEDLLFTLLGATIITGLLTLLNKMFKASL